MDDGRWNWQFEAFIKWLQGPPMIWQSPDLRRQFCHRFARELVLTLLHLDELNVIGGGDSPINRPDHCDICGSEIATHGFFVDGQTRTGTWANMCPICYADQGTGIGWDMGQLYRQPASGGWHCIAGDSTSAETRK